jgi:hypothetical protein
MKKIFNVLFFTIFLYASGIGQTTFEKFHGGNSYDYGCSVLELTDGFLIYGESRSRQGIKYESYLVKTNLQGDKVWDKYILRDSSLWDDYASGIALTKDSHFVFISRALVYLDPSNEEILLTKTDTSGNLVWEKEYPATSWNIPQKVICTSDSGFIIAVNDANENWIIKTDQYGDSLWSRHFLSQDNLEVFDIIELSDSNFVMTGKKWGADNNSNNTFLVKFNNNGDTLWTNILDTLNDNEGYSLSETSDNGLIIAGKKYSNFDSGYGYLLKTDYYGDTLWTRKSPINDDYFNRIIVTHDNYYVVSTTELDLMKFDSLGNFIWSESFNGTHFEGNSLLETSDHGLVLVGSYFPGPFGITDYVIIKADSMGFVNSIPDFWNYNNNVDIYPNPTDNSIYISFANSNIFSEIKIFDQYGQLQMTTHIDENTKIISIDNLASGLYILLITDKDGLSCSKKIIKR